MNREFKITGRTVATPHTIADIKYRDKNSERPTEKPCYIIGFKRATEAGKLNLDTGEGKTIAVFETMLLWNQIKDWHEILQAAGGIDKCTSFNTLQANLCHATVETPDYVPLNKGTFKAENKGKKVLLASGKPDVRSSIDVTVVEGFNDRDEEIIQIAKRRLADATSYKLCEKQESAEEEKPTTGIAPSDEPEV